MAPKYVLGPGPGRSAFSGSIYDRLREPIRNLALEEALFVTSSKLELAEGDGHDLVAALKRRLGQVFAQVGLVFVTDFARKGVWVYRTSWAAGNGRAIGAAKEDEIRSRAIDGGG